jgi:hypothetical protein
MVVVLLCMIDAGLVVDHLVQSPIAPHEGLTFKCQLPRHLHGSERGHLIGKPGRHGLDAR